MAATDVTLEFGRPAQLFWDILVTAFLDRRDDEHLVRLRFTGRQLEEQFHLTPDGRANFGDCQLKLYVIRGTDGVPTGARVEAVRP